MSAPRKLLLALALLLAQPVWAQKTGLLLGVAGASTNPDSDAEDFATIHAPEYETLWIAQNSSGEWKVLATLPELIVPRRDGFWHVGVKQVCEFDDNNESLRHVVWAAPVTKAGTVEKSQPCTPHKPEDYAGPYQRTEQDQNKISQCGFQLVNLFYVSAEIISMSTYSGASEVCEPRGGQYALDDKVRTFDSDQALSFNQLLGAKAHDAYTRALPKQGMRDDGEECNEPDLSSDSGWRIAHELGRWRPYIHQNLGYRGCSADAPVKIPLPVSLTGDTAIPLDWKMLRSKVADIADAYVSPHGDVLVAASQSETRIFEAHSGVPGKLLLKLPAHGIVMAQWATGTHVDDWTKQIGDLAKQHLPEPVVRAKAGSN